MADTHGTVHWTELMTRDIEAAKRYYSKICGWTFVAVPMEPGTPDYVLGVIGDRPVAGLFDMRDMSDAVEKPYWMSYFAVDDVDTAVAETVAAGGMLMRAPFDVPSTGRIAIVTDPSGALFGLMTPVEMPEG